LLGLLLNALRGVINLFLLLHSSRVGSIIS
jgi:hypothetical protein